MLAADVSQPEHSTPAKAIEAPSLDDLRVAHFDVVGTNAFVAPRLSVSPRAVHGGLRHLERFMDPLPRGLVVLPTTEGEECIELHSEESPRTAADGLSSWPEWKATIKVLYHAEAVTAGEAAELLGYMGALVGLGADCPAVGGSFGTFEVVAGTEYRVQEGSLCLPESETIVVS